MAEVHHCLAKEGLNSHTERPLGALSQANRDFEAIPNYNRMGEIFARFHLNKFVEN